MSRDLLILIVALVAFTASPILIRYSKLPAADLVAGRLFLSLLILLPFWLRTRGKDKLRLLVSPQLIFSGVMLGVHFILWTLSLYYTSIAAASVTVCISPVFIVVIERFWLKRELRRETLSGLAIALAGVVILLADDLRTQEHGLLGIGLALLAALLSAIYLLIGESARKTHRLFDYCMPVYFVGMLVSFAFSAWQGRTPLTVLSISGREWLILLGLAVLPTVLGHTAYNYILKTMTASTLSIASLSQPFLAMIAGYLYFREVPTVLGVLGGIVSLAGVYWVLRGQTLAELSEPQT